MRDKKLVSITVKATPEGFLSSHLVNGVEAGTVVRLATPKGDFALPDPAPGKLLFVTAGSGITPVIAMLRSLKQRGESPDIMHIHSAPVVDEVIFHDELRALERAQPGYRLHLQLTADMGKVDFAELDGVVPDWKGRSTWACGPPSLLDTVEKVWADTNCGTACTWSGSPSRAPTKAARAARSPSPSQISPSNSTAPRRC